VKARFWGTRGGFPVTGPDVLRFGGNTCAIEFSNRSGQRLLIDLGSGAINLGRALMASEFSKGQAELPILLSHTQLEHTQGLPFFVPFFIPGNEIALYGAASGEQPLRNTLEDLLNHHYSPINSLENLFAHVHVYEVADSVPQVIGGFSVRAMVLPHGSAPTLGFRVEADGQSVCVFTSVDYGDAGVNPNIGDFVRGANLLVHDNLCGDARAPRTYFVGQASVQQAISVAEIGDVGRLALFHHAPDADDGIIEALVEASQKLTHIPLFAAAEGQIVDLDSTVTDAKT